jgi:toxin ParE1/3/4
VGFYIDELAYEAAERFPSAVEQALRQIQKKPSIGSPRVFRNQALCGLRSWPVPGFENIRIYYLQPRPNLIRVLRVLHGKRDLDQIFSS